MKKFAISAVIGGVVGGAAVWAIQSGSFSLRPGDMSYEQLAALLLAFASFLVTVLGVGVAVLALWGYAQFKTMVDQAAQAAAVRKVDEEIKGGEVRSHIELTVVRYLEKGGDGTLLALLEARREESAKLSQVDQGWEEIEEEGPNGK